MPPLSIPTDSFSLTRREMLQGTAAALLIPGMAGLTMAKDDAAVENGWIDAHSHIWTPDTDRYPLANNQTKADLAPPSFTDDELLALVLPLGVARVVLIQHKPYHGVDNSYIVDAIARHPGVFSAVACIDAEADDPPAEMTRLAGLGIRGFRIRPGEGGADRWLDSPGMCAMWEYAGHSGLAICPLIDPEFIPQVAAMCERFPRTNVVVDHFARIGIDGTIRESDLAALVDLARHERTHVKVSAFYALGKKVPPYADLVPMIRALYDAYGPSRLMWASDSPYQLAPPNTYADSLALIRDRIDFLSDSDREWLLRKTAEQVYFGKASRV
jgi:predicted TIM-barrel fold metal-dependent hydrolase